MSAPTLVKETTYPVQRVVHPLLRRWERLGILWKFQICFWLIYGVTSLPIHYVGMTQVYPWKGSLVGFLSFKIITILLQVGVTTCLGLLLQRPFFRTLNLRQQFGLILVIGLLISTFISTVVSPWFLRPLALLFGEKTGSLEEDKYHVVRIGMFIYLNLLYGGWCSFFTAMLHSSEARAQRRALRQAETMRLKAEVNALRSQLNPHFLFNAMNTIASEGHGNEKIGHIVSHLSDYLRYILSNRATHFVTLTEEIEATSLYLKIEQTRHGDAIEAIHEIDPATLGISVPGILLQPLVENAVKYGMRTSERPLRIRIRTRCLSGRLFLEVANTGTWVEESSRLSFSTGGVGLSNVRSRLASLYPGQHELSVDSENGWVSISISIPTS